MTGRTNSSVSLSNKKEILIDTQYFYSDFFGSSISLYNDYVKPRITLEQNCNYWIVSVENNLTDNIYFYQMLINRSGSSISPVEFQRYDTNGNLVTYAVSGSYSAYITTGATIKITGYRT